MTSARHAHTDQLYSLLDELASHIGGPRRLRDCADTDDWPTHGVYFFYEDGETRANGDPRVVRVGTHALTTTSRTILWQRLAQHRGQLGGAKPGGGNHRGSVFRLHVGAALIRRGSWPEELLASWLDRRRHPQWAHLEDQVEREVSRHIGAMPFVWLAVPNQPSGGSDRAYIERNAIALLSGGTSASDPPSTGWLGRHAANPNIRASGLWNVNHVHAPYDPALLHLLADQLEREH